MEENKVSTRGIVLVVDDEAGVRALARRILEGGGYTVVEAGNGAEALKMMEAGAAVDFLIADLDMPIMRGEEMALRVRALRPHLKVLYVTGNIGALMNKRQLRWDAEAFLGKPFTATGLLEAVSLLHTGRIGAAPAPPSPLPSRAFSLSQLWKRRAAVRK